MASRWVVKTRHTFSLTSVSRSSNPQDTERFSPVFAQGGHHADAQQHSMLLLTQRLAAQGRMQQPGTSTVQQLPAKLASFQSQFAKMFPELGPTLRAWLVQNALDAGLREEGDWLPVQYLHACRMACAAWCCTQCSAPQRVAFSCGSSEPALLLFFHFSIFPFTGTDSFFKPSASISALQLLRVTERMGRVHPASLAKAADDVLIPLRYAYLGGDDLNEEVDVRQLLKQQKGGRGMHAHNECVFEHREGEGGTGAHPAT